MGTVLVIGSANIDVSVTTQVLPQPGHTVAGTGALIRVGGEGANQALAAQVPVILNPAPCQGLVLAMASYPSATEYALAWHG